MHIIMSVEQLAENIFFFSISDFQEWSEEESEEDDGQQPISREDSGIQLDRTPQEDQDNGNKTLPVTWTGADWSYGRITPDWHTWI